MCMYVLVENKTTRSCTYDISDINMIPVVRSTAWSCYNV